MRRERSGTATSFQLAKATFAEATAWAISSSVATGISQRISCVAGLRTGNHSMVVL